MRFLNFLSIAVIFLTLGHSAIADEKKEVSPEQAVETAIQLEDAMIPMMFKFLADDGIAQILQEIVDGINKNTPIEVNQHFKIVEAGLDGQNLVTEFEVMPGFEAQFEQKNTQDYYNHANLLHACADPKQLEFVKRGYKIEKRYNLADGRQLFSNYQDLEICERYLAQSEQEQIDQTLAIMRANLSMRIDPAIGVEMVDISLKDKLMVQKFNLPLPDVLTEAELAELKAELAADEEEAIECEYPDLLFLRKGYHIRTDIFDQQDRLLVSQKFNYLNCVPPAHIQKLGKQIKE